MPFLRHAVHYFNDAAGSEVVQVAGLLIFNSYQRIVEVLGCIKRELETGEGSRQSFIKTEAPRKGCYDRRPRGAGNEIGIVGGENHEGQ
jgi:hypothetical protein